MLITELSGYYGAVERHLDCPKGEKQRLLSEANRLLMDLQADDPDLDYSKVTDFFGEPKEFADFLMQSVDDSLMDRYEKRCAIWKYLKKAILICLAAAAIWYVCYTVSFRIDPQVTVKETLIIGESIPDKIQDNDSLNEN